MVCFTENKRNIEKQKLTLRFIHLPIKTNYNTHCLPEKLPRNGCDSSSYLFAGNYILKWVSVIKS